jgi:hypothetical protein
MKKSGKVIIDICDGIGEYEAVSRVLDVMVSGSISKGAKGKDHYCWHTQFHNGIHVSVSPKYGTDTDKFTVYSPNK